MARGYTSVLADMCTQPCLASFLWRWDLAIDEMKASGGRSVRPSEEMFGAGCPGSHLVCGLLPVHISGMLWKKVLRLDCGLDELLGVLDSAHELTTPALKTL